MNKILILIAIFIISPIFVVNAAVSNKETNKPDTAAQNQNKVATQNRGEEQQIQVTSQEQEQEGQEELDTDETKPTGNKSLENRSQNALDHMSDVAKQVQQLLQQRTSGGIGEQVRLIAQEQQKEQIQTEEELTKVDNRGQFAKLFIGPNYAALGNLEKQIERNQTRIEQLEELKTQLTSQSEIDTVNQTIEALIAQNTALQDRVNQEEQNKSLFGWLFRLISKE